METTAYHDTNAAILAVRGADAESFLQGLITNDAKAGAPFYAAILSPQGKYLFDFIAMRDGEGFLLEVAASAAQALLARLTMYKLRAKVTVEASDLIVLRGFGAPRHGGFADPRHAAMGWHGFVPAGDYPKLPDGYFDAARVENLVPQAGIELQSNESYILEMGFERLNGVSFKKGCYVGQEVTARMKHKTELRKGLVRLKLEGAAPIGADISRDGRTIGKVYTQAGGHALAYLRHDLAGPDMVAGEAKLALELA
ncbi:CAF17-like 4Fe-4S cluster assembly/insertion protein YgfZ [Abyssibius alkaniclasticus]|uniref:CAF17-like 4Fe-4S cluster assembly/insertion protein YgfZ n=1 Tax=Abyssibius alkaniclasticus TaxID=2881234 RepID=UPI00405A0811